MDHPSKPLAPAPNPTPTPSYRSPVRAVAWMLVSCAFLSGVAVLGRHAALEGVAVLQIVLLRLAFAALAMAPMLTLRGTVMLRTAHLRLYLVRVGLGSIGMITWFGAIASTPVGEATAIAFLLPLFATLGAALFLGERVGVRRWVAIGAGFLGALIILRPGIAPTAPGTWLAMISAVAMAGASLMIKRLSERDHPDTVVLISTLLQVAMALVPGLWVWQALSTDLWLSCAAMGVCGMLGHITLARALRAADTAVVMGADFARLPFAVLFGWLLFGELIDLWTWLGAAVIFAAALYAARRGRDGQAQAKPGAS
ncbi:MAG: DMT family transporter [Pseudomonadota bacterium]